MLTKTQKMEHLNQLLNDIELAVERGKAQQLHDLENGNHSDANTVEGLEHIRQATIMEVSSSKAQVLLERVEDVSRPLARAIDVL